MKVADRRPELRCPSIRFDQSRTERFINNKKIFYIIEREVFNLNIKSWVLQKNTETTSHKIDQLSKNCIYFLKYSPLPRPPGRVTSFAVVPLQKYGNWS